MSTPAPAPAPADAAVGTLRTKRARLSSEGDGEGGPSPPVRRRSVEPAAPGSVAMEADPRYARESFLARAEADGGLAFLTVSNAPPELPDDAQADQHAVWLIDLKNIYAKQLPNMPKEYIVKLVFDRLHTSLVALKARAARAPVPVLAAHTRRCAAPQEGAVVGGITFRVFAAQQLAEVAFCAVSGSEQVKGYGTRLMEKLKAYAADALGVTHLITFADNNAVGYFQKQAFTKEILLEREKWAGYIKEYDGGTLMECILGAPPPADFRNLIRAQREAVQAKVRSMTSGHVTHPGLAAFKPGGAHAVRRPGGTLTPVPFDAIAGLRDTGWAPALPRYRLVLPGLGGDGQPHAENMRAWQRALHAAVAEHPDSWPFRDPVDPDIVPDYYDVVKECDPAVDAPRPRAHRVCGCSADDAAPVPFRRPMDLQTIGQRIECGDYYLTLEVWPHSCTRAV